MQSGIDAFFKLVDLFQKGGPGAIIAIMGIIIVGLVWFIHNQQKTVTMLHERYNTVVDKKIEADAAIGQSLNQLRDTIWELFRRGR